MARFTFDPPFTLGAQIDARAAHPEVGNRPLVLHGDRTWTYTRYRDEAVRIAHFLQRRLGPIDDTRPGHVAMMLENHCELLALYGGCGYPVARSSASTRTPRRHARGRAEPVAGAAPGRRPAIRGGGRPRAGCPHPHRARERPRAPHRRDDAGRRSRLHGERRERSGRAVARHAGRRRPDEPAAHRHLHVGHDRAPERHRQRPLQDARDRHDRVDEPRVDENDTGYACMPLFHSNALYLAPPRLPRRRQARDPRGGSARRASSPDCFRHGVTYWNYVGEPVHYVPGAIESSTAATRARIAAGVTNNPANKLRYALGNGARRARHRALHEVARPGRDARALRLDRGRDLDLPQEGRPARLGRRDHGPVGEDPERARRGCPPASSARTARSQLRAGRRRSAASPPTRRSSRATSTTPRRTTRSSATACTTLGRSRPRPRARRYALPLLRPHRRLDPQGRRELLGPPGGASHPGAPEHRARGRLRRAVRRLRTSSSWWR